MIIKEKFSLLKETSNILYLSQSKIESLEIPHANQRLFAIIKMIQNRINHFTKNKVFNLMKRISLREQNISVIDYKDYPLIVSYNKPTKKIILNLGFFGYDDISYIDPKDIYATIVYGMLFGSLVSGKNKIKVEYSSVITSYMLSMFIRIFGKEYGLLTVYSQEIVKLKFFISCYVLSSFFGIKKVYDKAYSISSFNYPVPSYYRSEFTGAEAIETEIEPAELTVSVTVNVEFLI